MSSLLLSNKSLKKLIRVIPFSVDPNLCSFWAVILKTPLISLSTKRSLWPISRICSNLRLPKKNFSAELGEPIQKGQVLKPHQCYLII